MKSTVGVGGSVCHVHSLATSRSLLVAMCAAAQQVPKGQMPTLGRPTEGTDDGAALRLRHLFPRQVDLRMVDAGKPARACRTVLGHDGVHESRRTFLRSGDRRRRTVRAVQGARADRVSQGKQGAGAASDRLARVQLHAVWTGGRRSRRDLQHSLRQRTVYRQRQIGARAKRRCACSRHSTIEWRARSRSTAGRIRISERRGGEKLRRPLLLHLDLDALEHFRLGLELRRAGRELVRRS